MNGSGTVEKALLFAVMFLIVLATLLYVGGKIEHFESKVAPASTQVDTTGGAP